MLLRHIFFLYYIAPSVATFFLYWYFFCVRWYMLIKIVRGVLYSNDRDRLMTTNIPRGSVIFLPTCSIRNHWHLPTHHFSLTTKMRLGGILWILVLSLAEGELIKLPHNCLIKGWNSGNTIPLTHACVKDLHYIPSNEVS